VILYLRVTAVSGVSPTLQIEIQVKDPQTARYVPIGKMDVVSAVGDYVFVLYPGATESQAVANVNAQDLPLPRIWRCNAVIGGETPSFTFSLSGMYIV